MWARFMRLRGSTQRARAPAVVSPEDPAVAFRTHVLTTSPPDPSISVLSFANQYANVAPSSHLASSSSEVSLFFIIIKQLYFPHCFGQKLSSCGVIWPRGSVETRLYGNQTIPGTSLFVVRQSTPHKGCHYFFCYPGVGDFFFAHERCPPFA